MFEVFRLRPDNTRQAHSSTRERMYFKLRCPAPRGRLRSIYARALASPPPAATITGRSACVCALRGAAQCTNGAGRAPPA